jgi:hypothetical protein
MQDARSCRTQQLCEVDDVRTMRAKYLCLPGTAHARLEVTGRPGRDTGQRILEGSAFGRLNDAPL